MLAYHPNPRDQRRAIGWARYVLLDGKHKYVILDTVTTTLKPSDEIFQLAVIDLDGNTLFKQNIRPRGVSAARNSDEVLAGLPPAWRVGNSAHSPPRAYLGSA